jgi:2'-5' RNA ligase
MKVKHNYSWVFLNLPDDIQKQIVSFGEEIEKEDLYGKEGDGGLELDPHITVKYGLLTEDAKDAKERIDSEKGGKVYLGKSSIFENEKFDVIKIDVESKDLERLHNKLNALPHEEKHPDFHAHATIAYVKTGCGKKYIGKFKIDKSFKFKEVFFGDKKENRKKIKLCFNLKLYKIAQIWMSDYSESEDFAEWLMEMYKLEYKYSMVKTRPFVGNEVRRENIFNNLSQKLNETCDKIIVQLSDTIGKWLKSHALTNPTEWAEERSKGLEEGDYSVDDSATEMVGEYIMWKNNNKHSDYQSGEYERTFDEMLRVVYRNIESFPNFKSFLEEYFNEYRGQLYDQSVREINDQFNKKFRNENQKTKFIDNLTMDDMDFDYETLKNLPEITAYSIIKEFYAYFVFPLWFKYWRSLGIEGTRKLVEESYQELQNVGTVESKVAAIGQALNLYHQNGKMLDYLENDTNSRNLELVLDSLTQGKGFVEQANKELAEIGVQMGGIMQTPEVSQPKNPINPINPKSMPKKQINQRNKKKVNSPDKNIKDFNAVSCNNNWYKVAARQNVKPELKPYMLLSVGGDDVEKPVTKLENVRLHAYSQEQARWKFLKKYPWLQMSLGLRGYRAVPDEALYEIEKKEKAEKEERTRQISIREEERKKEQIENAWWNK